MCILIVIADTSGGQIRSPLFIESVQHISGGPARSPLFIESVQHISGGLDTSPLFIESVQYISGGPARSPLFIESVQHIKFLEGQLDLFCLLNLYIIFQIYLVDQVMTLSLMAKCLEQASQWHEMYCHDQEVMSSNAALVELGVRSTSVLSRIWTKHIYFQHLDLL